MAAGTYKNGVQIDLVYQAVNLLSGAAPVGTVYDEGSAVHSAETTALTSALLAGELSDPADGRYLGHFTPDAEGLWTVVIKDKNGNGEVTKIYNVCGHDLDSVGDAVAALDTADVASQLLLTQSTLSGYISNVESAVDLVDTADIASQLLLTKSSLVSAVLDDLDTHVPSQLLLTKSALVSAILVDCNASTSDVKSAVIAQASDVKSAVLAIASPASVS